MAGLARNPCQGTGSRQPGGTRSGDCRCASYQDQLLSQGPVVVVVAPGSVVRTAMSLIDLPFYDSIDAARASLLPG